MKKLLYIGHAYHNKTKSTQFLQEIFKCKYDITTFDFDPYKETFAKFEDLNGQKFDIVVLFQIMPDILKLKEYLSFDKIAFFPMYDGAPRLDNIIWDKYRECNIINFSKKLHEDCKKYGLSSYYIQYFPKPKEISNMGDEKSVFLWQRIEQINPNTVEKSIGIENINYLYHHQVPDPEHKLKLPSKNFEGKVQVSTWFDNKDEMDKYIQECAIYFAPRKLEGIGMSFLEAMAMGRCVIAPNYPTMNEYIQNGVNGYLYKNLKQPQKIKIKNIRKIQENAHKYIENGYKEWEKNKYKILDWIENDVKLNTNEDLMDSKLNVKNSKKISITLLKKVYTKKYLILYILDFIPIKIRKKIKEKE